jgi:DNA replication protein DnaC
MKLKTQIISQCKQLKLHSIAENVHTLADQAAADGSSYLHFISSLLQTELTQRRNREIERKIKDARLPVRHDLDTYDCSQVEGMPPAKLAQLRELTWLDQVFNLIIMGPQGIGKSMLAGGLCYQAIQSGYRAYFRTMDQLMTTLKTRDTSRSAQVEYRRLCKAHLIVIDDIMMIDVARKEANAFFHFINALHEKVSFIITTNKSPKQWAENLGDEVITTAVLDRVLYRCEIIKLSGESFRMKNRKSSVSTAVRR